MKVTSSLSSQKKRNANCQIVRRRGQVFVINKSNPRFKARQGGSGMANVGRAAHSNAQQNTSSPLSNTGRNAHTDE